MNIELTNTLTRRKEPFAPTDPARVTMYVCGPTVYNTAHIGNARPPVVFDTLFRLLRHVYGEQAVIYARNYTDIDDKIINASIERGVPIEAITRAVEQQYEADMGALNVLTPTLRPRATENVPAMVAVIEKLIERGVAYVVPSGVYFSVAADEDYGKLSGRSQDDLKAGARVDGEDDKRSPSDFALWKTTAKAGEPAWEASFGAGRPGWHIECSAMIEEELGSPIDIHGGGIDLIFPHHENEIAQSESAHGHALARVWMHNGFLTMDKEKMSKSIGNIITPRELLEQGWQGETIRWALLSAHYKAPLDWSDDLLNRAKSSLDRLYQVVRDVSPIVPDVPLLPVSGQPSQIVVDALADDLNTPRALAALFAIADELRAHRNRYAHGQLDAASAMRSLLGELRASAEMMGLLTYSPQEWFGVGGLRATIYATGTVFPNTDEVNRMIAARATARAAKNWKEADYYRDLVTALWVSVQDGAGGSEWTVDMSERAVAKVLARSLVSESYSVAEEERIADNFRADLVATKADHKIIFEIKRSLNNFEKAVEQLRHYQKLAHSPVLCWIVAPHTPSNNSIVESQARIEPEWELSEGRIGIATIDGLGRRVAAALVA